MSRRLLIFAMGILLLIISVCFVAYGYTRYTARNAATLLTDMQAQHLNASFPDAQRFIDSHAGGASSKRVNCSDHQRMEGEVEIRWDNRWLAKLHLAPPTNFAAAFTSSRGQVVRTEASIGVHRQIPGTFQNIYAAEVIEDRFDPELGRRPFYSVHKLANNTPGKFIPLLVQAMLDERATPEQRKLAYSSLNLSCLYRLRGCKDAEALAPAAWTAADKAGWHDETSTQESH